MVTELVEVCFEIVNRWNPHLTRLSSHTNLDRYGVGIPVCLAKSLDAIFLVTPSSFRGGLTALDGGVTFNDMEFEDHFGRSLKFTFVLDLPIPPLYRKLRGQ